MKGLAKSLSVSVASVTALTAALFPRTARADVPFVVLVSDNLFVDSDGYQRALKRELTASLSARVLDSQSKTSCTLDAVTEVARKAILERPLDPVLGVVCSRGDDFYVFGVIERSIYPRGRVHVEGPPAQDTNPSYVQISEMLREKEIGKGEFRSLDEVEETPKKPEAPPTTPSRKLAFNDPVSLLSQPEAFIPVHGPGAPAEEAPSSSDTGPIEDQRIANRLGYGLAGGAGHVAGAEFGGSGVALNFYFRPKSRVEVGTYAFLQLADTASQYRVSSGSSVTSYRPVANMFGFRLLYNLVPAGRVMIPVGAEVGFITYRLSSDNVENDGYARAVGTAGGHVAISYRLIADERVGAINVGTRLSAGSLLGSTPKGVQDSSSSGTIEGPYFLGSAFVEVAAR